MDRMTARLQYLTNELSRIQKRLENAPDGFLIFGKDGVRTKYYHKTNREKIYINRENCELASALAEKKYLECLLGEYKKEIAAIKAYLKIFPKEKKSEEILMDKRYRKLISKSYHTLSNDLEAWASEDYVRNTSHEERLVFHSISGNSLRSKTEAMIDMLLYLSKIPYRYECQLVLDGDSFYPDFTIRRPGDGKTYYWEHFGMMDNPQYVKKYHAKMQKYLDCGLIPDVNLIATYETLSEPMDPERIKKIIELYLLS